ncbi:MAG: divalent-cation tolerance protein CutA [Candidatus Blochmannia vicinus]|nr:MAG: divalent-cation tolerance protein CutA [Candidatus Blochmannia vicinus]
MIIILCTVPDNMSVVVNITKTLLNNKLAACITLHKVRSFYYWETTLKDHTELQLLIKTKNFLKDSVFTTIKKLHPYEVPELLALPIIDGEPNYLSWMQSALL